jgi:hypothetical protein
MNYVPNFIKMSKGSQDCHCMEQWHLSKLNPEQNEILYKSNFI